LLLEDGMVYFYTLNLGTLHTVVYTDDTMDIKKIGPELSTHPFFPKHTNVNFVTVKHDHLQYVQTFERGAGWTLSCGTGTAASAVVSAKLNKTRSKVETIVPGGKLTVHVDQTIKLEGPAEKIASGIFEVYA
jgi:diaminopimelate epimerase